MDQLLLNIHPPSIKSLENFVIGDNFEAISVIKKFNNQKLDLIQLSFNLTKTELNDSLIKVQNQIKSLNKRQYLYNLNYTVSNGNSFISPLIAINEFSESGKIVLDTIKNSMSKQVLESKYGKIFSDIVKNK